MRYYFFWDIVHLQRRNRFGRATRNRIDADLSKVQFHSPEAKPYPGVTRTALKAPGVAGLPLPGKPLPLAGPGQDGITQPGHLGIPQGPEAIRDNPDDRRLCDNDFYRLPAVFPRVVSLPFRDRGSKVGGLGRGSGKSPALPAGPERVGLCSNQSRDAPALYQTTRGRDTAGTS